MKKHSSYRILSLLLAFCIAAGAVWYGALALLKGRSQVTLSHQEGDPAALQGITLTGALSDPAFCYEFTLENGKLRNRFSPHSYPPPSPRNRSGWNLFALPAADAQVTPAAEAPGQVDTPSSYKLWQRSTDRIRLYLEYTQYSLSGQKETHAVVDTGVELLDSENGYTLFAQTKNDELLSNWDVDVGRIPALTPVLPHIPHSDSFSLAEDAPYLYWNLPWGGARIYRVDEMVPSGVTVKEAKLKEYSQDPATMLEHLETDSSEGSMEQVLEFTPEEASAILGVYPAGEEHMAVVLLRSAEIPAFVPDGQGGLKDAPGPEQSEITVQIYDTDCHLTDSARLLDLPNITSDSVASCISSGPSDTGFDDLNLLVDFSSEPGTISRQTAVSLRVESGRITAQHSITQPLKPIEPSGTPELLRIQMDETGTRTALLWLSLPEKFPVESTFLMQAMREDGTRSQGRRVYLDVMENSTLLYRGELNSSWAEDWTPINSYMGRQYHRELVFPMQGFTTQHIDYYSDTAVYWE